MPHLVTVFTCDHLRFSPGWGTKYWTDQFSLLGYRFVLLYRYWIVLFDKQVNMRRDVWWDVGIDPLLWRAFSTYWNLTMMSYSIDHMCSCTALNQRHFFGNINITFTGHDLSSSSLLPNQNVCLTSFLHSILIIQDVSRQEKHAAVCINQWKRLKFTNYIIIYSFTWLRYFPAKKVW